MQVVWDDVMLGYDFGRGHPMNPIRLELTAALVREFGLFDHPSVELVQPVLADDALLEMVHKRRYIEAVKTAASDPTNLFDLDHGLGTPDVPVFHDMHNASARVAGSTVALAEAVWGGSVEHAVNFGGGLHHAMPDAASGFCVYNDVALAIAKLLDRGAKRIAYVDVDVHHGDGTQETFYNDPRVMTISLHESGRTLFPGTGWPDEVGGPGAEGRSVNVALPAGTDGDAWLRAFGAVVPPLVRSFQPDVMVTQHGCDSHALDPLAHLMLSVDAQRASYEALHALSHEVCGGKWVAAGGGGYALVDVVPRAWTHLVAIAAGADIAPDTRVPEEWRTFVRERTGGAVAPLKMTDGYSPSVPASWDGGRGDAVDRAIRETREAIFPLHGLDPKAP